MLSKKDQEIADENVSEFTIENITDELIFNNPGELLKTEQKRKEFLQFLLDGKNITDKQKKYLEDNNINYNEYHNTDNINAPYLIEIKRGN